MTTSGVWYQQCNRATMENSKQANAEN